GPHRDRAGSQAMGVGARCPGRDAPVSAYLGEGGSGHAQWRSRAVHSPNCSGSDKSMRRHLNRTAQCQEGSLSSIINKIQRSLAIHGILGTFRLCGATAIRYLMWFSPSHRWRRAVAQERDLEFDRKWGVDTGGTVVPDKSGVVGSSWVYGIKY